MSAELKINFFSKFLWLSVFPWFRERSQVVMLWVGWFRRLKWLCNFLLAVEVCKSMLLGSVLLRLGSEGET